MKKLQLVSVILLIVLSLSSCTLINWIFGPDEPPIEETTKLTITSETEVTLELGQSYTLTYETDGSVTVEVSGGSYDADSQKFTATEAGTYTITATAKAEGKKDAVATVTVTVTAASADKTALSNSIKKTEGLIKSDYTSATWKALEDAVKAAKATQEKAGVSQDEVDAAAAAVDKTLAELASALVKAELSEDSFTWNETTYKAEDYYNFADVLAELQALNANAEITLKSQYTPEIDKILAKLEAKIKLNVKGDLINGASMIVEELVEYTLIADSDEGVTYSWTVDGVEVSTTAELKFTPAEYKTYEIKCTVSNGTNTNVKTISVAFVEADYVVNGKFTESINVDKNVISVTNGLGWGDEEGKKVTLPDLRLSGDFTVYFDVEFKTAAQPGVMALFFNNAEGNNELDWIAICQQANWLEVAVGGSENEKYRLQMTNDTTIALNTKLGFMATRTIVDGKAYFKAYLIDEAGNVLATNEPDAYSNYTGVVQLGIQAENAQFVVSNLAVGMNDQFVNVKALTEYLAALPALVESDYTADSWKAYVDAQDAAKAATSQAELAEKIAAIGTAKDALVPVDVVKVEIAENKDISFGGKTYVAEQYANIDDIIAELNALDETLNSVYAPKAEAILAKLVTKVTLDINWDGLDANNGKTVFVSSLKAAYELYATPSEGATVVWYVNGEQVKEGKSFDFVPAYGEHTVKCVATKGIYIVEKEVKVGFANPNYTIHNEFVNGITVENDVISVNANYGWGHNEGKKVVMSNVSVGGNFTVYFDVNFSTHENPGVMAFFFHKENGEFMDEWIAVCQHSGKLEVAVNGHKPQIDMPAGTADLGNTIHVMVTREIRDNNSWYKAYLLDNDGNIIATNELNDRGEGYTGAVMFGIQAENAHFTVSNVAVKFGDNVMNKTAMKAELDKIGKYLVSDYSEDSWAKVTAAKAQAEAAASQAEVDAATEAIKTALASLVPAEFEKAVVTEDGISYAGRTYDAVDYVNYADVLAKVNELAALTFRSEYNPEIVKALAALEFKLQFNVSGSLTDGMNAIVKGFAPYTLTASSEAAGVSYTWYVNGVKAGEGAEFVFTPNAFASFDIECKAIDAEGAKANRIMSVSFIEADVKTPMPDRVTVNTDGSFTSNTGIGWGDWEGRKVVYDDLVFNGSFSISMDITYNGTSGGPTVATIHLLNADTLSPSFGGDWAYVGYGCICLHENPVRLETNWVGTGKRQSSDGGFEAVAAAMSAAMSQLEVGDTFTVKLTCYRNANRQLQLVYALYNAETGEWIEFNRSEWAGDMGGGFIVGINIENVGMTASNVRYELLEETGEHLAGSVKSRAALSAALVKYESIVPSEYINSAAFVAAYNAAWAMMDDNSVNADYDTAVANLVAAAEALVKRDVAVSAGALDKGYSNYTGLDQFEAVIGVDATDVKWTYSLNGEAKEVAGNVLPLEVGAYTDVKLSFSVDGTAYTYQYQNFNVTALNLKSNVGQVTVNDGTVTVDNGDGWGHKEQLVIDGIYTQEFELVFNAKYDGTPGGAYQVMCINLFGEDIRPVFGYQREDRGNRGQLGFDNNGQWADINNTDAEGEAYDHIFGAATKFSVKVSQDAEGKFWITFTVYGADGNVIESRTCDWTRWYDSKTALRFTFENIDLTLSDFEVYYN